MINLEVDNCTGCGACVNVCKNNSIQMQQDSEGFYYPAIDEKKCVECGKCKLVCKNKIKKEIQISQMALAGYSNDNEIKRNSSSGGVFSELSSLFVENGGIVYGAAFDDDLNVHHIRINTKSDLHKLRGSKYVQSIIGDNYIKVKEDLDNNLKVLFSGTPCQIKGLYKYLNKDDHNLYTCSVICHGVPSPLVFNKYITYLQGRKNQKIKKIDFRNKDIEGWDNFYIKYVYDDSEEIFTHEEDIYFKGFLENMFLRKSCYNCEGEWKSTIADVILGDYWGFEKTDIKADSYYGMNAILVNTVKGRELIDCISKKCSFWKTQFESILNANPSLRISPSLSTSRKNFFDCLKKTGDVYSSIKSNLNWRATEENKSIQLYPIIKKYFERVLNKDSLVDFLIKHGKKRIVLYANTELLDLALKDINRTKNISIYLSDRNVELLHKKYPEEQIITQQEVCSLYQDNRIDIIIICSFSFENEIINNFIELGFNNNDIISILEYIYS